ncbi:mitochondrial inner membrane import translocase subunit [Thecamonas trahens ATCC 50062]|uniref:Mitochondrial inner membrane import translocase subunit n=1 Tax=Thecamonas trahens ATCC 50062 TaxID=461836 RepID=A0A0L0DMU8_THETB|nr:mitochondrial inner membrane import translocase subunit [Thecamonas trahens ATCC 50062]KNC53361.1 mitochondrial inner membrane import translocase subunit [Thecamonas trahens ATCC 50062]|eukprot:XP_013754407.1 mitochondrial inner membrane import translocase subunit [Thecamonas trahens ATCC 50062]
MDGRDPCPYRILDDIGSAFAMGTIGSGAFHAFKGARAAPKGMRMAGMVAAVKNRAAVTGGAFAIWMALFSSFDCAIAGARGKEDHFNPVAAGALTGALLAIRQGPRKALQHGIAGGAVLGVFEGVGMLIEKVTTYFTQPSAPAYPSVQPGRAAAPPS